jgi:hypothetical protein
MLVYGFLLLELVVPQGRRGFWFTLAIAPLGAISLLQIAMRSDSLWFDRAAMLLAASLGLLGWWLTGITMLAMIALLILLVCVVDVALHRRHLP